jgi:hypothetical protein
MGIELQYGDGTSSPSVSTWLISNARDSAEHSVDAVVSDGSSGSLVQPARSKVVARKTLLNRKIWLRSSRPTWGDVNR